MDVSKEDSEALKREKPDWTDADMGRLAGGVPLAYVIGHIPFLGLSLGLESRPLIPRPETEWWTEELCAHIGERPLRVFDVCAGSGAIGLAVLSRCPNAHVSFGELSPEHTEQIRKNLGRNGLDAARADIRAGDIFAPFPDERWDIIAANPPYIPNERALPESVARFEPHDALYAGKDGLGIIRRILEKAPSRLASGGELWLECDIENVREAAALAETAGAHAANVREDIYGRPRLLVAYY